MTTTMTTIMTTTTIMITTMVDVGSVWVSLVK